MMVGGRKPTPLPIDDPVAPKAPPQVKGRALEEWERVLPELMARRVLTEGDRFALAAYCTYFARWQDAEDQVAVQGTLVKTKSGNVIQHPAVGVANTAAKFCHRFAVELGLTPSSRAKTKPQTQEDDPLEMPL
jgi:P27 family predicted phage terminase small subunit